MKIFIGIIPWSSGGKKPEEIDPTVTARVPVNVSYDDGYFTDKYQGVPLDGFTAMFEKMINHENITIKLETEAVSLAIMPFLYIQTESFQSVLKIHD